jgi:hypothetical protein
MKNLITKSEMRSSKSSMLLGLKGLQSKQIPENTVIIYDLIPGQVEIAPISSKVIPNANTFDTKSWYDKKNVKVKSQIEKSVLEAVAFYVERDYKNGVYKNTKEVRNIFTADAVSGEGKDLMGYLITITYKTEDMLNTISGLNLI